MELVILQLMVDINPTIIIVVIIIVIVIITDTLTINHRLDKY